MKRRQPRVVDQATKIEILESVRYESESHQFGRQLMQQDFQVNSSEYVFQERRKFNPYEIYSRREFKQGRS